MRRLFHGALMGLTLALAGLLTVTVSASAPSVTWAHETGQRAGDAGAWRRLAAWPPGDCRRVP